MAQCIKPHRSLADFFWSAGQIEQNTLIMAFGDTHQVRMTRIRNDTLQYKIIKVYSKAIARASWTAMPHQSYLQVSTAVAIPSSTTEQELNSRSIARLRNAASPHYMARLPETLAFPWNSVIATMWRRSQNLHYLCSRKSFCIFCHLVVFSCLFNPQQIFLSPAKTEMPELASNCAGDNWCWKRGKLPSSVLLPQISSFPSASSTGYPQSSQSTISRLKS